MACLITYPFVVTGCDEDELETPRLFKPKSLKAESYYEIGLFKCECAGNIGMYLNIHENKSPSFNYFINKLNDFCEV